MPPREVIAPEGFTPYSPQDLFTEEMFRVPISANTSDQSFYRAELSSQDNTQESIASTFKGHPKPRFDDTDRPEDPNDSSPPISADVLSARIQQALRRPAALQQGDLDAILAEHPTDMKAWTSALAHTCDPRLKPSKTIFRPKAFPQYEKYSQDLVIDILSNEKVDWTVKNATSASRHHFFSCVANSPGDAKISSGALLKTFLEQAQPKTRKWVLNPTLNFKSEGELNAGQSLELTISFVFLQPRDHPNHPFSFHRLIHVTFKGQTTGAEYSTLVLCHFQGLRSPSLTHWTPSPEDIVIGKPLGKGSFGLVSDCSVLGLACAIKLWLSHPDKKRRDYDVELEIASKIAHDRVIPFIGANSIDALQVSFLLMKKAPTSLKYYLAGLKQAAEQVPLSPYNQFIPTKDLGRRLEWVIYVAEALDYMHNLSPPIVHRDVKSLNVVFDDPWVYLIDFGCAGPPYEQGTRPHLAGTSGWNSPEGQLGMHTPASDVYSLGILLYEVIMLQSPPRDSRSEPYAPKLDESMYTDHPNISALYLECTQNDPNLRPTMAEVIERLKKIVRR